MAQNIKLNKEVFNKKDYKKTINTSFTQLGVKTVQEQLDEQPTVQEFFDMYNTLFYQINEMGDTNSHEYLVKTSGDYIAFEEKDELLEALQKEIATLRKELLQTQQELANALLPEPQPLEDLPEIDDIEIEPIELPIQNIVDTPSPLAEETYDQDPNIKYKFLTSNLQHLFDNNSLLNNNIKGPQRDLKQANRKLDGNGKYDQWKKWIKRKSSLKDEKDLITVLDKTLTNLQGGGDGFL